MGVTALKVVPQVVIVDPKVLGSIRAGFGVGLLQAGIDNPNVIALCADVTESIRMQAFAEAFPERFIEVGVAEQNLVGVAAGAALAGKIPFAGSYAVFSPGRSWDQIRVSVCYSNLNVKIIGGHAGITVGPDGASHQALEDIAITRVLPNMTVVVPCDELEASKATLAIAQSAGPSYLRSSRDKSPQVTIQETPFKLGKANIMRTGKHVTIVACGIMVAQALLAANALVKEGIEATVINLHTIKPLDQKAILAVAELTGAIVTAEEHQVAGGLGSVVAEFLAQNYPVPIEMVGVKDTFGESGSAADLQAKYHLLAVDIQKAVWKVLARKK